ncbi:MAG: site-specific DNA-methyltransferase, partial [Thermodesulfobacteriota bacterium]|nr:site-specific DNA-methyltransferase [Thermodesulfobacteriota bacterium]
HAGKKRLNNPPVGLVSEDTEPYQESRKTYEYDPHLDPQLQWAGKAEHTSFEVPTRSLHVHERIDPKTIIDTVQKEETGPVQISLFESEKKPLREAIEFYKHKEGWSNRMIAGDSLLVMNSLLEKEGMAGKVQVAYNDPPYGIKYGSNFQPFVNKRDVKDRKDEDLTAEPEMIKAFRDTWELGIHSYLSYLRDRLLLERELLHESGSVFVQINDNNLHHVKELLDEVFGNKNCINTIPFKKRASYLSRFGKGLFEMFDYIVWYAKDIDKVRIRTLYKQDKKEEALKGEFRYYDDNDGVRNVTDEDIINPNIDLSKVFRTHSASKKSQTPQETEPIEVDGKMLYPPSGHEWKTDPDGMTKLREAKRLVGNSSTRPFKIYFTDFPYSILNNLWDDTLAEQFPLYAVQTDEVPIQRCLLMTTDPGDLVIDPTCGSGTTAYVAEQWGRRWITCDTSRVALTLAKQRLMTANFNYYQLAHPQEGVGSGFMYKTVPHITLKSIANNEPAKEETLYDQPKVDRKKTRITGPFTVEAVPSLRARSLEDIEKENQGTGESVARSGETLRQAQWRDELLKSGVRTKGGRKLGFTRVQPLSGIRWIQCEAETREDLSAVPAQAGKPQKVFVVFGPEHAPLEQRMVENAWQEAKPFKPDILLFCAFQFDDEAAKDIDELKPEIAGMQLLKVQMNADLFTDDLKKKRSGNDSFWLIGQPDVEIKRIKKGDDKGKYQVEVLGFDYYNPKTGNVDSGGKGNIAMWLLDTNYDDRSLFPSQVFFPMAGAKDGWSKLARNLKAEIDKEKIKAFKGTVSLSFEKGGNAKIAVKIIDDRGIESLRVISI